MGSWGYLSADYADLIDYAEISVVAFMYAWQARVRYLEAFCARTNFYFPVQMPVLCHKQSLKPTARQSLPVKKIQFHSL